MSTATSEYKVREMTDRADWDVCFDAVPQPHLMQAWAYGDAKRNAAGWHVRRYVFERGSSPVAICQVLEKRVLGLRVASRVNRGPLFLEPDPSKAARENVYRLLRQKWRHLVSGPLLIAPALPPTEENAAILQDAGFRRRKVAPWCSALIDLQHDERRLHAGLSSTWRNRLRQSQKAGLELRACGSDTSVQWMLDMHARNMAEKNFSGPTRALVLALYRSRPAGIVVLTAMLADKPVGAMLIAKFGMAAEYYLGWFGAPEGRKVNSGNFLYWHAALEMRKAGLRWLDLGGYYSNDKFGHFKQGMGGAEYKLIGEWCCF